MKCPICNKEYEDWRAQCPYCKGKEKYATDGERSNADCLSVVANINLAIFIIASLYYFYNVFISLVELINYSYVEGITIGINLIYGVSLLLVGFTVFFLLKTIVDIYYKINKTTNK